MSRITGEPRHKRMADDLRQSIQSGSLTPGALVPSERDLARHYMVSKPTAARALAQLRREGLVTPAVGTASFVASPLPTVDPQMIRDRILAVRPFTRATVAAEFDRILGTS